MYAHSVPQWGFWQGGGSPGWGGGYPGWGGGYPGWGGGYPGWGGGWGGGFPSGGLDIIGAEPGARGEMMGFTKSPLMAGPGGGGPGGPGGPGGGGPGGGGPGGPGGGGHHPSPGHHPGWNWGRNRFPQRTFQMPFFATYYDPCSNVRNAYLMWRYSAQSLQSTLWGAFVGTLMASQCWTARSAFALWAQALRTGSGPLAGDAQLRFESALFGSNPYGYAPPSYVPTPPAWGGGWGGWGNGWGGGWGLNIQSTK